MKVEFYSTRNMPRSLKREFLSSVRQTLRNDSLVEGKACREFEEDFADYLNVAHALGVGNGFDALKIGLQAIGLGPGDRVALPAHTFIATWYAVLSIGAVPIGVDVTPNGQLDLDQVELLDNLQAVIPVHMHGSHCDMVRLTTWAKSNKIKILEDCAQAAGLNIQGKKAGTWGDAAAFSFYPTKNLFTIGDGGAIVTNNETIHEKARMISRYGSEKNNKYQHVMLGQNSRLDTIQAKFLSKSLNFLDEWNCKRSEIARDYLENLEAFALPKSKSSNSVYHHFAILVENRNEIREQLQKIEIGTEIHYPNVAGIEVQSGNYIYPVSSKIASQILSLPISPWQQKKHTNYVIDELARILCIEKKNR